MGIEVGRTPNRLAGVVDDEIQAVARLQQLRAERFDARRMTQIEPEDLEAMSPVSEVRLARVPIRRVARKACRDDETSA